MNIQFGANVVLTQSKAKPAWTESWLAPGRDTIESRSTKKKFNTEISERYPEAKLVEKSAKNERWVLTEQDYVDFQAEVAKRAAEADTANPHPSRMVIPPDHPYFKIVKSVKLEFQAKAEQIDLDA